MFKHRIFTIPPKIEQNSFHFNQGILLQPSQRTPERDEWYDRVLVCIDQNVGKTITLQYRNKIIIIKPYKRRLELVRGGLATGFDGKIIELKNCNIRISIKQHCGRTKFGVFKGNRIDQKKSYLDRPIRQNVWDR